MLPFKDVVNSRRAPGWPGPASRKAAEAISKYVITDMYAKGVQGMVAKDAVKWGGRASLPREGTPLRGRAFPPARWRRLRSPNPCRLQDFARPGTQAA